MNVRLLRKIAKVIQEKPREFDLRNWHHVRGTNSNDRALCDLPKEKQISCKTTHCIAGWAQVLSPKRDCGESAEYDAGMKVLDEALDGPETTEIGNNYDSDTPVRPAAF